MIHYKFYLFNIMVTIDNHGNKSYMSMDRILNNVQIEKNQLVFVKQIKIIKPDKRANFRCKKSIFS